MGTTSSYTASHETSTGSLSRSADLEAASLTLKLSQSLLDSKVDVDVAAEAIRSALSMSMTHDKTDGTLSLNASLDASREDHGNLPGMPATLQALALAIRDTSGL